MKTIKYIIISLVVILTIGFTIPARAQDLEGIDLPAIPQLTKPISEMSIAELQAKIQEILVVIQQLQTILAQLTGQGIQGIPSDYSFSSNLKYGTSSNNVKYLQIMLNQNSETRVSDTGWGSPGNESIYFGEKTLKAVIKFQEKYSIPNTGYVGPITRTKLNEFLQQAPSIPTTPTTPTTIKGFCGDNIIQTPNSTGIYEICDNTQLGTNTCLSRGYTGGTLSCSSDCLTFDTIKCISGGGGSGGGGGGETTPAPSQPVVPVCGNNTDGICPSGCNHTKDTDCTYCGDNILQGPNSEGVLEVCDTNVLNNQTCLSKGFPGGTLKCSNTCLTFDTSACTSPPPSNQAPILNTIGNKSVNENQQLSFTVSATDPDQDTLTYSVQNNPSGASFNSSTKTFNWTPSYTQSGTYTITFTVSDSNLTDTETMTITVNNVNRPPILNDIGNKTIAQNNTLTFTISGTDPDGDTLTYSAQNLPSGASFNSSTKTFTWTPSTTGTFNTTFTVSDGALTDTETITITVNSSPTINNPPTSSNQNLSLNEDNSATIILSAADPNGDALTYSVVSQPSKGAISGTPPNLTYTPNTNYNGPDSFTFKANDGKVDSNIATISLTINPINDAPILAAIGSKTTNENQTLTFQITATDIDSATLTYSIQNSPSGASFNASTKTFSWTPSYTQSGTYTITFIVSDGELTDSETMTITVNNMPEPSPQDCKTSTSSFQNFSITQQRGTFTVEYDATPNNSSMDGLMMLSNAAGSTYDNYAVLVRFATSNYIEVRNGATYGKDLNIAYTPGTSYHFKIEVDIVNHKYDVYVNNQLLANDYAFRTSQNTITSINYYGIRAETGSLKLCNFQITSSTPPANRAPVLNPIGNKSVVVNNALTFTISATDPDGDTVTYSATNLPSGATFNVSTRTFSWTPTATGTYNVTFTVLDGSLTDSETITITVNPAQPSPVCGDGQCNGTETCSTCSADCGNCPSPTGNVYYLDAVNGNDANPGTSSQPWKTINRAKPYGGGSPQVVAGDTVYLRGGYYGSLKWDDFYNSGGDWVTYAAENPNDPPIFQEVYLLSSNNRDSYLIFDGIRFPWTYNGSNIGSGRVSTYKAAIHLWPANHIKFLNCFIQGAGTSRGESYGVALRGRNLVNMKDITFYNCDFANTSYRALWFQDVSELNVSHSSFEDIFGSDGAIMGDGIQNSVIEYNTFNNGRVNPNNLNIHLDYIQLYVVNSDDGRNSNVTIRNNRFSNLTGQNSNGYIFLKQMENVVIENNVLFGKLDGNHPLTIHDRSLSGTIRNNTLDAGPYGEIVLSSNSAGAAFVIDNNIINGRVSKGSNAGTITGRNNIVGSDPQGALSDSSNYKYSTNYNYKFTNEERYAMWADPDNGDYHPLMSGFACDGSVNPPGVAVGALPCVGETQQCSGTDTSCGTYPNCQNCNSSDGCSGTTYKDYRCSGTSCVYTEYPNDSRCAPAPECTSGQTRSCNTGLQGICSSGTQTCQSNGTWGTCVQNNQPVAEICNDSLDNDCDGTTDCSDSDCSSDPACQTPTPTIPTDYISYWKFEGNAQDEKGINNGAIYGNPVFVSGVQGQALSFDGVDDYVDAGDIDVTGDITVSVWVNSKARVPYQSPASEYAWDAGWWVREGGEYPGHWEFHVAGRGTATDPASIVRNQWVHLVGINNGTNILLYKDGVLVKSAASSGATQSIWQNLFIGRLTNYYFNGPIDNVMIYNRALTASEIQNIYNSQKLAMRVEPGQDDFFLKNLASILAAIQNVLEKLKLLF